MKDKANIRESKDMVQIKYYGRYYKLKVALFI